MAGTTGIADTAYPAVVSELPPPEPVVFEELFQVGIIPSELCPLHSGAGTTVIGTPLVDAALRQSSGVTPRRIVGPDGHVRLVGRHGGE
jgi:hypothetical protein